MDPVLLRGGFLKETIRSARHVTAQYKRRRRDNFSQWAYLSDTGILSELKSPCAVATVFDAHKLEPVNLIATCSESVN
jgi:hypothetical protein